MAGRLGRRRTCGLLTVRREGGRRLSIICRLPEKRTYAAEGEKGVKLTLGVCGDAMTHNVTP